MNGTANGALDSGETRERKSSIGSKIPTLQGKVPRKPPPEGYSARKQPTGGKDTTHQPINTDISQYEPIRSDIILNGNGTKVQPKENGVRNELANGFHDRKNDVNNEINIAMDTECNDDVTTHGIPQCFMTKIRRRSGTLNNSDGESIDLSCVERTDTFNAELNGVDNQHGIPRCFMEKIRHRSGGTVPDANGNLTENGDLNGVETIHTTSDDLSGVVLFDIRGVDENNRNSGIVKDRKLSEIIVIDTNGVLSNGTVHLEHVANGNKESTDDEKQTNEIRKKKKVTKRKSKLPTIPKTSYVKKFGKRVSSDNIESSAAGCSNLQNGIDNAECSEAKTSESKIPVSKATNPITKETSPQSRNKISPTTVHIQQFSYFERRATIIKQPAPEHDEDEVVSQTSEMAPQSGEMASRGGTQYIDGTDDKDHGVLVQGNKDVESDDLTVTHRQQLPCTTHYSTSQIKEQIAHRDVRTKEANQGAKIVNKQNVYQSRNVNKQDVDELTAANKSGFDTMTNGNGQSEEISGSVEMIGKVRRLTSSNGSSFHKLVANPQFEKCLVGDKASKVDYEVPNGVCDDNDFESQKSAENGNSARTEKLKHLFEIPLEGAGRVSGLALESSAELGKCNRENLQNLEVEFMKTLNKMDHPREDRSTVILKCNDEVSAKKVLYIFYTSPRGFS